MLNEERSSDCARRYATALMAEGRKRLRDKVPSIPGELVAEVLWQIETALPHMTRVQLELELLGVNKLKGAEWRKYTTPRKRVGEEAECWRNWAQTRKKIAQRDARADEDDITNSSDAGVSLFPIQPVPAAKEDFNCDLGHSMVEKPLSKGFSGDGNPMTFSKLRRIVIRAQVLLIEYASRRSGENVERLRSMLWHQSSTLIAQLEAIDAWEACHRLIRRMLDSGFPLEDEQSVFDLEFEKLQKATLAGFQSRLRKEADLLERQRKHYGEASATRT